MNLLGLDVTLLVVCDFGLVNCCEFAVCAVVGLVFVAYLAF